MLGTSNQSVPVAWPLKDGAVVGFFPSLDQSKAPPTAFDALGRFLLFGRLPLWISPKPSTNQPTHGKRTSSNIIYHIVIYPIRSMVLEYVSTLPQKSITFVATDYRPWRSCSVSVRLSRSCSSITCHLHM